ncbi:Chromodomain-helicase-DNA-binding 4 [Gossypium arboreum]|uniref:Chromodomain-helicase-DNA-binding 4 n=1 Tax=Gossypium arboreum TaxID=29729 RepID=A0A0B0PXV0_GOSAR|nr:Chromodomain-helicase-DNA-binding 4 [Gossypium arboreum]
MKPELDYGVDGSLGQTREAVIQSQTQASSSSSCCKRVNSTQVNGYIVYTRVKKSRIDCRVSENLDSQKLKDFNEPINGVKVSLIDEDQDDKILADANGENNNLIESRLGNGNLAGDKVVIENVVDESLVVRDIVKGGPFIEALIEESHTIGENAIVGNLVVEAIGIDGKPVVQTCQSMDELETRPVEKGGFDSSDGNDDDLLLKTLRWPKKSLLRPKVEAEESLGCEQQNVENTAGLRGIITDGGILCSCSLCKGRRVVPPSQFEIHACKQYKRAAQYICFENGKSLLEVLRACRRGPLHTLEATIQNIIRAVPEQKCFTCRRCKGSFPVIHVGQVGPLCNSCVELKKSQFITMSSPSVGTSFRSQEPVSMLQSFGSASLSVSPQNRSQRKKANKSSELDLRSNSPQCSSSSISLQNRRPWKTTRKLTKPGLFTKSLKSASVHISSQDKGHLRTKKKPVKPLLMSKMFKGASSPIYSPNGSQWKMTTKDQRLHKLVFEEDGLPDGTEVAYYARGQRLLEGYKKGFGIICRCCNYEVSPSQFEAHAGWASRRKPYAYIYTSNGVSLHELAISLSKGRLYSAKDNDVACIICADGGNLLLCDGCPRAFHKECASLPTIPHGRWYCKYCQNMLMREKCAEHNANAAAAGRILGVDAIEQITSRCVRIVKSIETELSGCALCRACDFSKSGFGPRTVILCDQCEKEYHIGCLRTHKMADLREIPKGKWFCCSDCGRIHSTLQKLLIRGAERLPDSLLDILKKKYVKKGLDADINIDVRWRLLSSKFASPETRLLLSQAVGIFHECFNPIVDATTGRDLIPCMVYGRNLKGQEYGGMYCAVLTINSFVVSAGIIRVFGQEIAEIPLVATSIANHGKGYFQLLFSCIEKLLAFLNVKNIILPAAEEAESIWTDKFGFKKLRPDQLSEYRKSCCQMVIFQGTSMLQKEVPIHQLISSIERRELYEHLNQGISDFLE